MPTTKKKYKPAWMVEKSRKARANGIPKTAVRAFLNRDRRDLREYKGLTDRELDGMEAHLPVEMPLWSILRHHQRVCAILGATYRKFAFFNDTGTGKTLLAIALGRYYRRLQIESQSGVDRIIILVPIRSNKYEWAREIRKHSPRTKFQVLEGSTVNKWQQIEENPDSLFFIETYGGFVHLLCRKVPSKKKGKQKMEPDPKLVRKFCKLFQGAVSDEGTVLGQRDNLPRRLIRQVVKAKNAVYFNLTGTPFGRDPSLVHSQMSLVDEGWTLGETLGLFRAAFFKSSENNWGGIDYEFDTIKDEQLHKFLAHQSIRYEVKQSDLPTMVHDTIEVKLDASADVWLERAASAMKNAKGNYQETKNAFLRMRQISSGFVGYKDDESGDKAEFEFDTNPKLEAMLQKVEEIDPRHKGIIFCDFQYSNQRIADALKESGIGFLQLYGKTKNPESVLSKFDSDPDKQWLILSNAMAIGLNLQIAQYGFFYESPVSVIMRKQARRRFERQGSEHDTVFLWDMITLDTYDQRILDFHEQGKSLFDAIVNGEVRL